MSAFTPEQLKVLSSLSAEQLALLGSLSAPKAAENPWAAAESKAPEKKDVEGVVTALTVNFTRPVTYGEVAAKLGVLPISVGAMLSGSKLTPTQQAYVVSKAGRPGKGFFRQHAAIETGEKKSISSLFAAWDAMK